MALVTKKNRLQLTLDISIQVPCKSRVFFCMVLIFEVGNRANTKFWTNRWLHGERLADLVPKLFGAIPKWLVNTKTIRDAISSRKWVSNIKGALSWCTH
jgi:hypothetical protein